MMQRIAWNDDAASGLSKALPSALILSIIEQEVRAGISHLWECRDESHNAYCVTRMDANPTEWVMVAFQGTGMEAFGKLFVAAANERGIPIRAHVTSPIVERLLRRLGLRREFGEVVLRTKAAA